jgi:hypothetical protein
LEGGGSRREGRKEGGLFFLLVPLMYKQGEVGYSTSNHYITNTSPSPRFCTSLLLLLHYFISWLLLLLLLLILLLLQLALRRPVLSDGLDDDAKSSRLN